jgi:hypothetical protein
MLLNCQMCLIFRAVAERLDRCVWVASALRYASHGALRREPGLRRVCAASAGAKPGPMRDFTTPGLRSGSSDGAARSCPRACDAYGWGRSGRTPRLWQWSCGCNCAAWCAACMERCAREGQVLRHSALLPNPVSSEIALPESALSGALSEAILSISCLSLRAYGFHRQHKGCRL